MGRVCAFDLRAIDSCGAWLGWAAVSCGSACDGAAEGGGAGEAARQQSPLTQPMLRIANSVKEHHIIMHRERRTSAHVIIAKVAERLGLPEGDTLQLCHAQGWQADARSGMLHVPTVTMVAAVDGFSELWTLLELLYVPGG